MPPGMNPGAEEAKQEVVRQTTGGGNIDLGGAADVAEVVADVAGAVVSEGAAEAASAALEVGGEVLGGAMEALGSGFEVVGGCAEGCSIMIAVIILLAAASTALAFGLF
jgi:hypothetical protein